MKKVLAILRGLAMYAVFLLLPAGLWICAQLFLPASWQGNSVSNGNPGSICDAGFRHPRSRSNINFPLNFDEP